MIQVGKEENLFSNFFSFVKCRLLVHRLLTSELLKLAASDSAQIAENSKGFTNHMRSFRFRVRKVEICCFEGDAFLLSWIVVD